MLLNQTDTIKLMFSFNRTSEFQLQLHLQKVRVRLKGLNPTVCKCAEVLFCYVSVLFLSVLY